MAIVEAEGLKFEVRPNSWDVQVINSIIYKTEYAADIKEGDKVVDIGGHIGSFSILCASKGATVEVYEPHPDNYKQLVKNIKLNGFEDRITAHNKGIGEVGEAKITTNKQNMGSCHLSDKGKRVELIQPKIECDIVKIDCEGCEYNLEIPKARQLFMELHHGKQKRIINDIKQKYASVKVFNSNAKGCKIIWASN